MFVKNTSFCPILLEKKCFKLAVRVVSLSLYSLYYAETCNEFAGPISASLHPGNTASFEEMSQQWQAVGNTVSKLTGPIFEPQTSCSRDECVTAQPTGRLRVVALYLN